MSTQIPGYLLFDDDVHPLSSVDLVNGAITFTVNLDAPIAVPAGDHSWRVTSPDGASVASGVLTTATRTQPRRITLSAFAEVLEAVTV